jgi:hypothetical protein
MKKILIASLAILLISSAIEAYALSAAVQAVCGANVSCTYTSMDALTGSGYTGGLVGYNEENAYSKAMSWTEANAASGYTVKRVSVRLKKVGSPTFTITVNICTNNETGPKPNTCTAIGTLAASGLTTSFVDYTVDYATGYAIADSTRYWIALMPDAVGDSSNHVMWESSATGDENLSAAGSNGTWFNAADTSFAGYFSVYKCE